MNDLNANKLSKKAILILGLSMIIVAVLIVYAIYALWPTPQVSENGEVTWNMESVLFGFNLTLNNEKRLIILVLLSGFLGSYVHIASSFTNYSGERKLDKSWLWWYILRPFIGMSIALIFYFVFRGGFFTGNTLAANLNTYGVLTLAALSGLFSDRATLKLKEIFDDLFKPLDNRKGKLKEKNGFDQEDNQAEG